jgi:hypothetical protein
VTKDWPANAYVQIAPYDPGLHRAPQTDTCSDGGREHEARAIWSVVWHGERWALCNRHLPGYVASELRDRGFEISDERHEEP